MRNIQVLKTFLCDIGVKNVQVITCDTLNQVVYFATSTCVSGFNLNTNCITSFLSLCDNDYLEGCGRDRILSLHYLLDQDSVCISTTKGDLLVWQPELNNLECVGSVDAGFTCAEWSPDQELMILTTCNGTLVVMTKDFDPLCEYPIHTKDFGEAEPITVGWGKKETQFHGSAGKEAAKQKAEAVAPVAVTDDRHTEISWRGDGQLFSITSVDENTNCRYLRIFDRDGKLQATNEIVEGLENCISWRPSGNLIACSQRKPNKHDVIFFEKNGLQHGEFTLPFTRDQKKILKLSWNMNSDILAVVLEEMQNSEMKTVQLWTVGNYHWYLKQEMNFKEKGNCFASMAWDPEDSYVLHIITTAGLYSRMSLVYHTVQSKGVNNVSMVSVIDGSTLLLTPMKLMVVPPPMSTHSLQLEASLNMVSFGVGSKQHDIMSYLSNKTFCLLNYLPNGTYTRRTVISTDESLSQQFLRHLTWFQSNLLAVVVDCKDGNSIYFLKIETYDSEIRLDVISKLVVPQNILLLFLSDDAEQKLYVEDSSGNIYEVTHEANEFSISKPQCTLPQPCSYVCSTHLDQKNVVFGLTDHFRLFMDTKEIANNCTSILIHDEFLLMTTHSHTLRSIYLSSLAQTEQVDNLDSSKCFDESIRRVERGSKLVTAVQNGTLVVLQMPRGNLESIHPRALTVTYLQKLLSNLDYGKATQVMLKNRINLNLIYDHDPQLFLSNVNKFIQDVSSVNTINLFLADLTAEDVCATLYHPYYYRKNETEQKEDIRGSAVSTHLKVDIICEAVRGAIKRSDSEKFLLALLTTYAKQSKPDLETVLLEIKQLKDRTGSIDDRDAISFEKALSYVLYLVDVDQLFDISLGLYDFDIVLMVAEKSQKDPKEYLPFLNNFKKMGGNYRKFSIDKYLKKYSKALIHLVKCQDRFAECKEFVKEQKLYKEALKLYPSSSAEYKEISYMYGEYLRHQKLYEDAGIIFSRSGYHEEALAALLNTTNWQMALREAKILKYSGDFLMKLCRELSDKLKGRHMFQEAAFLLEMYVKDVEESVVCLLEGGLWFQVLRLVHDYDREDLIETNLKPCIFDQYDQQVERIEDLVDNFTKHQNRLKVVIQKKEQEALEILEGTHNDPENDLFSDTSSITGQSVSSFASNSSQGSAKTGYSRKSRNKVGRKKYKLREGSKHEDYALKEALSEIVTTADKMKEEVNSLLKILVFYYEEEKACNLQNIFAELVDLIEKNIKEIWSPMKTAETASSMFGPHTTVQSIIDQRQNISNSAEKDPDEPVSTQPTIRSNFHWKIHLLRS